MTLRSSLASLLALIVGINVLTDNARALDVGLVFIDTTGGDTPCFEFAVSVTGDGTLTAVKFTPPVGPPIDVPFDEDAYNYEEEFPSLDALRTKFPLGSYSFEFNGGDSSATVPYSGVAHAPGFVDITSPVDEGETSPTPTFTVDDLTVRQTGILGGAGVEWEYLPECFVSAWLGVGFTEIDLEIEYVAGGPPTTHHNDVEAMAAVGVGMQH